MMRQYDGRTLRLVGGSRNIGDIGLIIVSADPWRIDAQYTRFVLVGGHPLSIAAAVFDEGPMDSIFRFEKTVFPYAYRNMIDGNRIFPLLIYHIRYNFGHNETIYVHELVSTNDSSKVARLLGRGNNLDLNLYSPHQLETVNTPVRPNDPNSRVLTTDPQYAEIYRHLVKPNRIQLPIIPLQPSNLPYAINAIDLRESGTMSRII